MRLAIAFHNEQQHVQSLFGEGMIFLGGAPRPSDAIAVSKLNDQPTDCHLQAIDDPTLCETHCCIDWSIAEGKPTATLTNLGRSIVLATGPRLHRGQRVDLPLPCNLCLGDTQVQVFWQGADHPLDSSLATLPSNRTASTEVAMLDGIAPGAGTLSSWLETLSDMQRSVAGSHSFFTQAARSIFNPGGLDGGLILLPTGDRWTVAGSHVPYPDYGVGYREDIVEQAVLQKETLFHDARLVDQQNPIDDLHSAVASPVVDNQDDVIAVVYGFRSQHRTNSRRGVRALEAQFVRVIADSISASMTRIETEAAAAKSRALMDQAFSPMIARQLENDPRFLEGKKREVTVLFADLRGFSTIAEQVGPKVTYELLTDVMDRFSQTIADHSGVVIDFFGDGLSAFWNAPIELPEHPLLACECARAMVDSMTGLNERWSDRLNRRLQVGVGVHTGQAMVGNSGSRTRLKYGPQGNTVNQASRIEGLTRHVGSSIVLSEETARRVEEFYLIRRICRARLAGIQQPSKLYQILPLSSMDYYAKSLQTYHEALTAYEAEDFTQAISLLTELQLTNDADSVSQFLLIQAMIQQEGKVVTADKLGVLIDAVSQIAMTDVSETEAADWTHDMSTKSFQQ